MKGITIRVAALSKKKSIDTPTMNPLHLSPSRRVLLEKLADAQLVKRPPKLYGI
jgi:hypothetical protein